VVGKPRRPRGWIFRGRDGEAIAKITVTAGRIVVRSGSAWPYALDETPQRRVALRLALGTTGWCTDAPAAFHGSPLATAHSDRAGRFRAQRDTPAPSRCAPLP